MTDRHQPGYKRPPRPSPQLMVTLPAEHWAWIEAKGQRSAVIRGLVEQAMKGESK